MDNKQIDELIRKALSEEESLPEGLSDRLDQYINSLSDEELSPKKVSLFTKQILYLVSGIAASLILGIAVFTQPEQQKTTISDTFTDPQEAAIAAEKALAFMSIQLNKGLDQVSDARQEIRKVNYSVYEKLK